LEDHLKPRDVTPEQMQDVIKGLEVHAQYAIESCTRIIIGAPSREGSPPINSASGILVRLENGICLATAHHVVAKYEKLRANEDDVILQITTLPLDLSGRRIHRRQADDLIFIEVSEEEASRIGSHIYEPRVWPPEIPSEGQFVYVVGLPVSRRTRPSEKRIEFGPLFAELSVKAAYANHFTCVLDRDQVKPLGGTRPPTDEDDFGGVSGGPVFVESGLHYPLAGLVKEDWPSGELFVVQGLRNAPVRL
jgi:hypothetical protein